MSPFKSEHKQGLSEEALGSWGQLFQQAKVLQEAGNFNEALTVYSKALSIDDRYAELYYQIGRAQFAIGDFDEAEKSFWRAIDEDVAPLRMLSEMRDIILDVATDKEVLNLVGVE